MHMTPFQNKYLAELPVTAPLTDEDYAWAPDTLGAKQEVEQ